MNKTKGLNDILVRLFQTVLKIEEDALKSSSTHRLSMSEIHVLVEIEIGKSKTMTQVASGLKISVGALTTAMNKLVKKGYVDRSGVPQDRRIVKVGLTEEGKEAVNEHEAFHESMVGNIFSSLSEEQQDALVASLENIDEFFQMQAVRPIREEGDLELKPINIGNLKIPVPIFQGGMGAGISMGKLAGAVAACGGVGCISAAQPGYKEEDHLTNTREANIRALKNHVKEALSIANKSKNKGLVAVNVMYAVSDYAELVLAAIEAGAQMIVTGAGLPLALPGICKDKGIKLVPIVSSSRAIAILRRNWAKKYNKVPDGVIFEGPNAGGHLGFKNDQIEEGERDFFKTILEIKKELADLPNCPLIVGGGIYSKEDGKKVMAYGADGIQIGSRFVTTEECDAHENFKQAFLKAKEEDIVIVKSPVGMPARAIKNKLVDRMEHEKIPSSHCIGCLVVCPKKDIPFCIADGLLSAANGEVENGMVFCGSKVWKQNKMETVEEIFKEFTED